MKTVEQRHIELAKELTERSYPFIQFVYDAKSKAFDDLPLVEKRAAVTAYAAFIREVAERLAGLPNSGS